jgi:hypothetical protein
LRFCAVRKALRLADAPSMNKREKQEEDRRVKLELIGEQVRNGSLVIRQMTAEERLLHPPRPPRQPRQKAA